MSVYNGERFLAEAVDSILGQTFTDFEFIIIDDGSTDKTTSILAEYAKRDPRVRVISQENKGRTASLNIGIGLAKGKYIARMDPDDISLPDRLQQQAHFMELRPGVGLLGGGVELVGAERRRIRTFQPPLGDAEIRVALRTCNPFFHPVVMMRKGAILAARGYRSAFRETEDYDLFLRIAERDEVANLAGPILLYRVHPDQASARNTMHQAACFLAARAAASLRARGGTDPMWQAHDVTPEILRELGVSAEELRQAVLFNYNRWLDLLIEVDADAALPIKNQMLEFCAPEARDTVSAGIFVRSAGAYYRRGRFTKALVAICRAVAVEPVETGHHLRMALTRRIKRI